MIKDKVQFSILAKQVNHQICFQPDEASPEEKKTRLKKADSIRRMLADSSATPVVRSKAHLNI